MRILFYLSFSLLLPFIITAQEITVDGIWSDSRYYPNRVSGFNFYQGDRYTRVENNTINLYSINTGEKVSSLFDPSSDEKFGKLLIGDFELKNNHEDIIFISQKQPIYRHSFLAKYQVYDRSEDAFYDIGADHDFIMYADVSPNGQFASYVQGNNIYIEDLKNAQTEMITSDGKNNEIINGSADWVYEEEFGLTKAYEWSPNGKYIAYLKFDERNVPNYSMNFWVGKKYPVEYDFKYPKVGEENAVVSLHIYDIDSKETSDIDINSYYIPRIHWNQNNELYVTEMNRLQNDLHLYKVMPESNTVQTILNEKSDTYISINEEMKFLSDGSFVWISEKDGWNHVYIYDENGQEKSLLTKGDYDVIEFYGIDEKNGKAYFQASSLKPMYREIFEVDLDGSNVKMLHGDNHVYSAKFSKDYQTYILKTSSINHPTMTEVYDISGKRLRVLEDNKALSDFQKEIEVNEVEYFTFNGPDDTELYGWMIKPDNFDSQKKYPVLMYQYGGPNSQQVLDTWKGANYWWFQMLADRGYLIACVDNRGTGARGEAFRKMTYQQLGKYETEDQIAAAQYLGKQSYVDADRIGIWGWSYGGFMAANAILKGNDVFSLAISVAPVTNWKWYDTIYTERFMKTDKENYAGYEDNSPVNFADRLKGDYLLIHGMADDNVHFQHSIEMANALISAGKQFDTYFYPNRNHSIYGAGARPHLYHKMTNFIEENL